MPFNYNPFTRKLDYYTTVSGGGGTGVTDHGALTGLINDDHPQYLRTDGIRQLSGDWDFGSYTISGTGDIYCDDLYASSGSVHIGTITLSEHNGCLRTEDFHAHGDGSVAGYYKLHHGTTPSAEAELVHSILWIDPDGDLHLQNAVGTDHLISVQDADNSLSVARGIIPTTGSDRAAFNFGGGGSLLGAISDTDALLLSNAYYNDGYKYLTPDEASAIKLDNGRIDLLVALSGDINDPIPWITAFSILEDGSIQLAQISAPGVTTDKLYNVSGDLHWNGAQLATGGSTDYILIREEQPQSTPGGGFTSGAWQTRVLNTEVNDAGNHALLSSNQITLATGTYRFRCSAPAMMVNNHKVKLKNITDTIEYMGQSARASSETTGPGYTRSEVSGQFTIAGSKVFELQHRCTTTRASNGFGGNTNFGTEVYSVCEFWKV